MEIKLSLFTSKKRYLKHHNIIAHQLFDKTHNFRFNKTLGVCWYLPSNFNVDCDISINLSSIANEFKWDSEQTLIDAISWTITHEYLHTTFFEFKIDDEYHHPIITEIKNCIRTDNMQRWKDNYGEK